MDDERMTIDGGSVYVANGTVTSIDFRGCGVTLGRAVHVEDCTFDSDCVIEVAP